MIVCLIIPGVDWTREIDAHLNEASIILLLISADFLASDYCYGIEMKRALERHVAKEAHVIPILLGPVDWQSAPFEHLKCLPRHGKPVTEWDNRDAAFRDIAQGIRRVTEHLRPTRSLTSIGRQNRQRFLKQVRTIWIEGMLAQSLRHTPRIELELLERPDALENPWQPTIQEWKQLPRPLPAGINISQLYDDADGQLLILGEPGAGKTILLLELARVLLERAEQDEHQLMPTVLNLSSWAEKRQPFTTWLVEELQAKYRVPHKVAQAWVDTNQVLLLLDGLDEVAKDARVASIQAINTYYDHLLEQGPASLVICCRSQDYMVLPTRIALQQAISIQPLTEKQINDYFQRSQGELEGLQQGLRDDLELYKLIHNPLMLNNFHWPLCYTPC